MSWLDAAGHLSFVLTATSFALRDMLLLRCISVLSGLVGVIYNYNLPGGPLWLVICWLLVFMAINTAQVVALLSKQQGRPLSEDEQHLAETTFRHLAPGELRALLGLARWETLSPGQAILSQGRRADRLVLLTAGEVAISRGGAEVARAQAGAFVGELGFLSGAGASASVAAVGGCRCLVWPCGPLRARLRADPALRLKLQHAFFTDLGAKLGGQLESRGQR